MDLSEKYYVRRNTTDEWEDITEKFVGVKILKIDGFNELGDAVNVYNEQWQESQSEDFLITGSSGNIIRKNVDLSLTFICGTRYGAINTQQVHDTFIEYMTKLGDFFIKSKYTGKEVHVVCLKGYKPTTQKLHRGVSDSYIMGTVELHTLDMPQTSSPEPTLGNLYIGFGGATISDPTTLTNVQHFNTDNPAGSYTIACPSLSYLWVCFNGEIGDVTANGFEVPMNGAVIVGDYRCYRTANDIKPHTMTFNIEST